MDKITKGGKTAAAKPASGKTHPSAKGHGERDKPADRRSGRAGKRG